MHTDPIPEDAAIAGPEPVAAENPVTFRLAFAPGVTPAKWVGVWRDRFPDIPLELIPVDVLDRGATLRRGAVDAGLLRLPIEPDGMSVIPLYTEVPVVVVPRDHVVAAFDEVSVADLADETFLHPLDELLEWPVQPGIPARDRPATTGAAIELVAAGVGVAVVPMSVARLHHRKDLVYRLLSDGPVSRIGFVWVEDRQSDLVEEFIGIVRGRTANSSRGRGTSQLEGKKSASQEPRTRTKAQEKAAAAKIVADRRAAASRKAGSRGGKLTGKRLGKRGNR